MILQKARYFGFIGAVLLLLSACSKNESGCTDVDAYNYDPQAISDDGSCLYDTVAGPYGSSNFSADMSTVFSEDWDDWDFDMNGISGSVSTSFTADWDDWDFNIGGLSGSISTSFSENWDDWNLTTGNFSISIYTKFSNDWDNWEVNDDNSSWTADVATSFSEDWDNWEAQADSMDLDIETVFSEDFDNWDATGFCGTTIPLEHQLAVLFVPVIVNVLRIQAIIP